MKKYKFDYIKEMVEKWAKDVPKDVDTIKSTPFLINLPWIDLDDNFNLRVIPAHDHYGEEIEDVQDWIDQRNKYCEELAEEYKNKKQ